MKNKIYLSFDISTTCIGISVFDENKDLIEISHLVLTIDKYVKEEHRYLAKANMFRDYIEKFKDFNVLEIFVEEPLGNSNNRKTANLLMKFNGICCYVLYKELSVLPSLISVHDVRKKICPEFVKIVKGNTVLSFPKDLDKKHYIFEKVSKIYPELMWLKDKNGKINKYNYDMADSIAVGLAFLKF